MAKKTKKKTKKKTDTKKSGSKKAASGKAGASKKKAAKKTTTKKAGTAKKTTKKKSTKKTTKKKAAKKSTKKESTKKKSAARKSPAKKAKTTKKTTKKKAAAKSIESRKSSKPAPSPRPVLRKPAPDQVPEEELVYPAPPDADLYPYVLADDLEPGQLKKLKSGLTKKQVAEYFKLLLEKRAEIYGDYSAMEKARSLSAGELSNMPLHMADVGSDNFDQEFTLGLMQSERRTIADIEQALDRCQKGSYGICFKTGRPIPHARRRSRACLGARRAIPAARKPARCPYASPARPVQPRLGSQRD